MLNHGFLSHHTKATRVLNSVAAGTSVQKSSGVDMTGFDAVRFTALFGALTATQVTSAKLQHSDTDVDGDYVDVTGGASAALADGDGTKMLVLTLLRPSKKFVRLYISRGTANAVIDGVIAEQYLPRTMPVTQSTTVKETVLVGPAA